MQERAVNARPKRLLEQVRDKLRTLHYSYRTAHAYVGWIKRFVLFHNKWHPKEMGHPEVETFLTHLATQRGGSASTQNQSLCSMLVLYKHALGVELGWVDGVTMAKRPERVPVVLTRDEVAVVLQRPSGSNWLMGHRDVTTTQICTHVLQRGGAAVRSPVDGLLRSDRGRVAAGA